ncbi:Tetratricopeptide repeat-containing protein [Armatimonadetes bacterium GBS]|jgi:Flp pilus assembly protein TadD|nr:Beta-barrel assembly-enhancing protease [bacterium HR14]GIV14533.1 MAG: hypothetical protein KatS3mg021_2815 [Fimbriimonadales bacterium]CUU05392.1 Tetratricopeptide repeat-containing protein [Armatimonadetes bacterium GBS]CUU33990.1 Tetratricopeptide repeat-containing protein [Armatimonadetes bacterium GXS]
MSQPPSRHSVDELIELGRQMVAQGSWQVALRYLRLALQQEPDNSYAHALMALAYQIGNNPRQALNEAMLAVRYEPDWYYPHYVLGIVLKDQGRLERAEVALRRALALEPQNASVIAHLADLACRRAHWQEAVRLAHQALSLEPTNRGAQLALALARGSQGQLDEAERIARHCLSEDPEDPDALWILAMVAVRRGDWRTGWQLSLDALAIDPEHPGARETLIHAAGMRSKIMVPALRWQFWVDRLSPVWRFVALFLILAGLHSGRIVFSKDFASTTFWTDALMFGWVCLVLFWLYLLLVPPLFYGWLRRARDKRLREAMRHTHQP